MSKLFLATVVGLYVALNVFGQVQVKPSSTQSAIGTKTSTSTYASDGWKPFLFQGKWGYKNAAGDVMLTPEFDFDFCWPFSNGMARIQVMGYYSYINEKGENIIPNSDDGSDEGIYDEARDFSEGLAAVMSYETEKWVYIDLAGKIKFYEQFDNAYNFYGGNAIVKVGELYYFIDKTGKKLFGRGFVDAYPFQEDIAYVKEIGSNEFTYISRSGSKAFTGNYKYAYGFNNGQAVVITSDRQCLLINKKGETQKTLGFNVGATYDLDNRSETYFVSGLAVAFDTLKKQYFYIDQNFEKKSDYYYYASPFDETGRAFVAQTKGTYKFINTDFAPVFNSTFIGGSMWARDAIWTWVQTSDSLYRAITRDGEFLKGVTTENVLPFRCGYSLTLNNGQYKFINYKGEQMMGPYKWANNFNTPCALAPVQDDDFHCYFIDRFGIAQGDEHGWTYVGKFMYGYAPVGYYSSGKYWFVDYKMNNAFNKEYEGVTPFNSFGYAKVKLQGKWGLIDTNGKLVIPCTYSSEQSCPFKPDK